ncbi:MAG: COX15/CtaA family protein [Chloroflexota bacterium]
MQYAEKWDGVNASTTTISRFTFFAWGVLAYNLLVILWGAFVRATGSGAGCGNHWPACNGEIIPHDPSIETLIELSHRITSGFALIGVIIMMFWAWRLYPRASYPTGHRVRRAAAFSTFFIITEALIGAGLVLFEYVAANASIARAYWMAGHLVNTFFLLAALTMTAWWSGDKQGERGVMTMQGRAREAMLIGIAGVGVLILGASGGITALGDTLILTEGLDPSSSPVVATLKSLRIYHPVLAFVVWGLLWLAVWSVGQSSQTIEQNSLIETARQYGRGISIIYVVQLLLGGLNVYLKAPVWLQLVHLLMSDLIWIGLILMAASALSTPAVLAKQP